MKSQNIRNQGFLQFLLDDGSIRIREPQELQDLGPDPQHCCLAAFLGLLHVFFF